MDVKGGLINWLKLGGVHILEPMDIEKGHIEWLDLKIGKAKIDLQGGCLSALNTRSGELDDDIGIRITVGKTDISIVVTSDQVTIWNQKTGKIIFTDFPEGYKDHLGVV